MDLAHRLGRLLVLLEHAADIFVDFVELFLQAGDFRFRVVNQLCHLLHAIAELDVSASDTAVGSADADSQDVFAERAAESRVGFRVFDCRIAVGRLAVDADVFDPCGEFVVYRVELFDHRVGGVLGVATQGVCTALSVMCHSIDAVSTHAFDINVDRVALCFGGSFVLDAAAFARGAIG
jgi:hypothetical protein